MTFKKMQSVLFVVLFSVFTSVGFAAPKSFSQAKRITGAIFLKKPKTLYCSCQFNKDKTINLSSCNMESADSKKRAHRIEWEHMMPAEHFGKYFPCWHDQKCYKNNKQYKGRKCCQIIDAQYRETESELYNLWPAVGIVNQTRSNYPYAKLNSKKGFYGCSFEIDKKAKTVEPADEAKGIVARANLFMAYWYSVPLSATERKLFDEWNKKFPPTQWEKTWAAKVAEIEGYHNPYVDNR